MTTPEIPEIMEAEGFLAAQVFDILLRDVWEKNGMPSPCPVAPFLPQCSGIDIDYNRRHLDVQHQARVMIAAVDPLRRVLTARLHALYRQANSTAPISRLPAEILERIFRFALPVSSSQKYYKELHQLRSVSGLWMNTIEQNPSFWTALHGSDSPLATQKAIQHSRTLPLHARYFRSLPVDGAMERWQSLHYLAGSISVAAEDGDDGEWQAGLVEGKSLISLEALSLSPDELHNWAIVEITGSEAMAKLRTLRLKSIVLVGPFLGWSRIQRLELRSIHCHLRLSQLVSILSQCAVLVELNMHDYHFQDLEEPPHVVIPAVLASLEQFSFTGGCWLDPMLLDQLRTPKCSHISVSCRAANLMNGLWPAGPRASLANIMRHVMGQVASLEIRLLEVHSHPPEPFVTLVSISPSQALHHFASPEHYRHYSRSLTVTSHPTPSMSLILHGRFHTPQEISRTLNLITSIPSVVKLTSHTQRPHLIEPLLSAFSRPKISERAIASSLPSLEQLAITPALPYQIGPVCNMIWQRYGLPQLTIAHHYGINGRRIPNIVTATRPSKLKSFEILKAPLGGSTPVWEEAFEPVLGRGIVRWSYFDYGGDLNDLICGEITRILGHIEDHAEESDLPFVLNWPKLDMVPRHSAQDVLSDDGDEDEDEGD